MFHVHIYIFSFKKKKEIDNAAMFAIDLSLSLETDIDTSQPAIAASLTQGDHSEIFFSRTLTPADEDTLQSRKKAYANVNINTYKINEKITRWKQKLSKCSYDRETEWYCLCSAIYLQLHQ